MSERERVDEVEVASREEVQAAVRDALSRLRLSRQELEEQARQGRFTSERARLLWSAIREVASPA
jgi:hypothetical protein